MILPTIDDLASSYVQRLLAGTKPVEAWEGVARAAGSDKTKGTTLFVASTPQEDRALDVVAQDWSQQGRLRAFQSNPTILDNHNPYRVAGRGLTAGVKADTGNLEIEVQWDLENPDPLTRSVGHQHLNGFRLAASVGFSSGRKTLRNKLASDHPAFREEAVFQTPWGEYKWAGIFYEKNTLLELSSASVPMNPFALEREPRTPTPTKALELAEHVSAIEDPVRRAAVIAQETTPAATADALIDQMRADQRIRRMVLSWFEAGPSPAGPAPTTTSRTRVGDGLDHLFLV